MRGRAAPRSATDRPRRPAISPHTAEVPATDRDPQLELLEPARDFSGLAALREAERGRSEAEFDTVLQDLRRRHAITAEEERRLRSEWRFVERYAARDDLARRLEEALLSLRGGGADV